MPEGLINKDTVGKSMVGVTPEMAKVKEILNAGLSREQVDKLKEIVGENTSAIRVLAGGTVQSDGEKWNSPSFQKGVDSNGITTGAHYRVIVTAVLKQVDPSMQIVVGGRYPPTEKEKAQPYEVVSKELDIMGVEASAITVDPDAYDTISELIHLIEMAEENDWKEMAVVTSDYHTQRVQMLIDNLDWLATDPEKNQRFLEGFKKITSGEQKIKVISAEDVISILDKEMFERIKTERNLPEVKNLYQRRLKSEEEGVKNLVKGFYSRKVLDDNGQMKEVNLKRVG